MGGEAARVREALAALVAAEGLLAGMDAHVLLQVVLELERLLAQLALEFPQQRRLVVADHVPLQAVNIRERLVAYFACLQRGGETEREREREI